MDRVLSLKRRPDTWKITGWAGQWEITGYKEKVSKPPRHTGKPHFPTKKLQVESLKFTNMVLFFHIQVYGEVNGKQKVIYYYVVYHINVFDDITNLVCLFFW